MAKLTDAQKAEIKAKKDETKKEKRSFYELLHRANEKGALIDYELPAGEVIELKPIKKSR